MSLRILVILGSTRPGRNGEKVAAYHGYPAVLKSHLDAVYAPWNRKPLGIVSYGSAAGGYRAAEQLRQVAVELQMVPVREQVGLPLVWTLFDEEGRLKNADALLPFTRRLIDDVLWWAGALKPAREASAGRGA